MPREIDMKALSLLQMLQIFAAASGLIALVGMSMSAIAEIEAAGRAMRTSSDYGLTAASLPAPSDSAWRRVYDSPIDLGRSRRIFGVTNFNHDAFERMAAVYAQILPTYNHGEAD